MDEKLQEDWLDARLRDEAPYIDDAGFTARVVKRLPPSQPRHSFRALLLLFITLLASTVAYFVSDGGQFIVAGIAQIASLPLLWVLIFTTIFSLVLTSLATVAAFAKSRQEPLG
jgi:hypothetical protein